ncbi:hypothetical protein JCM33374_g462 [Metschnikowia sp. JCM 33374]|nr:hypothetical protein JCM33374_g462 [Metschnikowia sp. JCM 33374]
MIILRWVTKPFTNLSPGQTALSVIRIGSAFLAVCMVVVIFVLQSLPSRLTIARINCAHLDVAFGIYKSLRSSLTESVINKGASNNILPIDSGLSDSEIGILTQYAQTQVSSAPQSFLLGSKDYCSVNYVTDFSIANSIHNNITVYCSDYNGLSLYDYRTLFMSNNLDIIVAYAYQDNRLENAAYKKRVISRAHRYDVLKIVYSILLAHQVFLLVAGLAIYGNRGNACDLSNIPKIILNVVAVVSLTSGSTMIVSTAIFIVDLFSMAREIKQGLGDFGINMTVGTLFFALLWSAFAFTCLGMLSWVLPVWCSNPPEDMLDYSEEVFSFQRSANSDAKNTFTVRPYQLQRHPRRTSSRLFDHVEGQSDSMETSSETRRFRDRFRDHSPPTETSTNDKFSSESSSKTHSEHELRKLGEKLSRNLSVRQMSGSRRQKRVPEHLLLQKKDTHNLLYGTAPFSNHQYPQSFSKPLDTPALSRAATLTYDTNPAAPARTRHLSQDGDWQFRKPKSNYRDHPVADDNSSAFHDSASLLDEAEIAYLDNNRFINNLTR